MEKDKKQVGQVIVATIAQTNKKETPNSNGKGNQAPQMQVVKDPPPTTQVKTPTVEEQRGRQKQLNALFEKEAKLVESRDRLKHFVLSADENNNHLTLRDARGSEFKTGNPEALKSVIALLQKEADETIAQVQAQIITT